MYSKMPTKPKICIFFRFGLPTINHVFLDDAPMCGSRQGDKGSGPPPALSQNLLFLSHSGLNPLKNHKESKPAVNVGPSTAPQQNAILMAFRWRADGGLLIAVLPSSTKKKTCQSWTPLTKFSWSAHGLLCHIYWNIVLWFMFCVVHKWRLWPWGYKTFFILNFIA